MLCTQNRILAILFCNELPLCIQGFWWAITERERKETLFSDVMAGFFPFPSHSYFPFHFASYFSLLFPPFPPFFTLSVLLNSRTRVWTWNWENCNTRDAPFQAGWRSNPHLIPSLQQALTFSPSKPCFCSFPIPWRTFLHSQLLCCINVAHSEISWPGETLVSILQRIHARLTFQEFRIVLSWKHRPQPWAWELYWSGLQIPAGGPLPQSI